MTKALRTLLFGAAMVSAGAMFAQDVPTVEQLWITHEGFDVGDVRSGNYYGGKIYVSNGTDILTIDGSQAAGQQVETYAAIGAPINRGLTIDDAGNIMISAQWAGNPANAAWKLIKAEDKSVSDVTLAFPDGNGIKRSDMLHRAVGNFFSPEGGVFFLTRGNGEGPNCYPVWMQNGEQTVVEYATEVSTTGNNMSYAIPSFENIAELNEDELFNQFYYYSGNSAWDIVYPDADMESGWTTLPQPSEAALATLPAGWVKQTQNGFEVFTLGDKKYIVRMMGDRNWCSNFIIHDTEGNILFHSNYGEGYDNPTATGNTGNGCGLFARKIDDKTVMLGQIFKCGVAANSFAALYKISLPAEIVPEKELYAVGGHQGWDPAAPTVITKGEDGKWTWAITPDIKEFKLSTAKGSWPEFNAGAISVEGGVLTPGEHALVSWTGNSSIATGNWTLAFDLDAMTVNVSGEEVFTAPELYLRGEASEWNCEPEYKMTTDGAVAENGTVKYTWTGAYTGKVKIGNADWSYSFGLATTLANGEYELVRGGEGNEMEADFDKVTFTFLMAKDPTQPSKLTVEGIKYVTRKAYAYALAGSLNNTNNSYDLSFKSTGDAEEADIILINGDGETAATFTIQNIVKGENTYSASLTDVPNGTYKWAVRLISGDVEAENAGIAYEDPEWYGTTYTCYGGVAVIRDPESDAFGYTVVGRSLHGGFKVFDQCGEVVGEYHKNFEEFVNGGSSTMHADALRGYAVFANWNDKGSGLWVIDPLNPETRPWNMILPEGATQEASGAVTYNGVKTASGTPTFAVTGYGEDTKVFTYDEDIYNNLLVRYDLGTENYITAAPTGVFEATRGELASQNVEVVEGIDGGFFVAQKRADGNDANVPVLLYYDKDGNRLWNLPNDVVPNCSGGFAINAQGNIAALTTYEGVRFFVLNWNEGKPELTPWLTYDLPMQGAWSLAWAQVKFDAANNLHMFSRAHSGYKVIVLPGLTQSYTPAKAADVFEVNDGLEGVSVEDTNAAVRYFNLQGIEVAAEDLTPGIYVRRQGNKAVKVTIR